MSDKFYIQDSRQYVGNDILFWAKNGCGYTTDLSKAGVYSKIEAIEMNQRRETDKPWPKEYLDKKTRPAVDMQYVRIDEALKGTGIKLNEPEPYRKPIYHCHGCGRFMSERQLYSGPCEHCDTYNTQ